MTYQIQHLQGNDVKYSVFKSEEQSSTPEVYYEGLIQNYVDVDGLEAVYLPFPSGTNLNAPLEVDQTVLNIFNCGEHDMYPTITLNEVEKSFSV